MEEQKMNGLKLFLDRTGESSAEKYVTALEKMEEVVRKFYSEPLDHIGGKELVEMMLLDGCFIIELIFYSKMKKHHTIFYLRKVARDLLLVENQLPFPVLSKLYSLSSPQLNFTRDCITDAVISFFNRMMPAPLTGYYTWDPDVKHLLDLLHVLSYLSWIPPQPTFCSAAVLIDSPTHGVPGKSSTRKWQYIRSATELNEAGIKFQKNKGDLFDIKFQKEVMSIPTLKIDDDTESILRNLVAYEQCYKGVSSTCFTDYITFMDRLINTRNDVELLCRCGVLDNWLGDHEVVATMFNRLSDSVVVSCTGFFNTEIFNRVNEHCNKKWNVWKAILRHNYFNTPWALISSIAAVILLLSTLLQALFSILSYHH